MMSVLGVRHSLGGGGQTALLWGGAGTGKSVLVKALAEAVGAPLLVIPLDQLAETNWQGRDLGNYVSSFALTAENLNRHAVVLLDNLESVLVNRSKYRGGSDTTRSYHEGKQQSLIPLLDGLAIGDWDATQCLVIVVGNLPLPPDATVSADALVEMGLIRTLAERLAEALPLQMAPPSQSVLQQVVLAWITKEETSLRKSGLPMRIAPETAGRIAHALTAGPYPGGVRSGLGWLRLAIAKEVRRRLELGGKVLGEGVVGPDDVEIPPPPRPRWLD